MSSASTKANPSPHAPPAQKSRLLPWNRKLRHLKCVTLRNLSLSPSRNRARGRTIDDEALPSALRSPAKLLAVSESNRLAQSRSFTDLKTEARSTGSAPTSLPEEGRNASSPKLPKPPQPRRRSTLEWSNASAGQRQETLRDAIAKHTANIFFSLHSSNVEEPIYISETVESSSNPNFRYFDLNALSAAVTRQDNLKVNFWTSSVNEDNWSHLLGLSVNLTYLEFIGPSFEELHRSLPENCVIFHLQDGLYACLTDLSAAKVARPVIPSSDAEVSGISQPTSSYDALKRLATLDECIQEAIVTREKLTVDINALIAQDKQRFYAGDSIAAAKDSVANIDRAKESEKRQIKSLTARLDEMRKSLRLRRESMETNEPSQNKIRSHHESHATELDTLHASYSALQTPIRGQRRRICSELSAIYPIDAIPNKSLLFTIRSLPLPNSNFSKSDISKNGEAISAALGHAAHLTYLLSLYLAIPLPYPITPCSSTSTVHDPISLSLASSSSTSDDSQRTFPLCLSSSSPFYRFEYGVFLLNKDIELMASKLGLRVMDLRQTLPNLKYILYVATAGEGEVPTRKAGGVRGLMFARERGEKDASPAGSRPGSIRAGAGGEVTEAFRRRLADVGGGTSVSQQQRRSFGNGALVSARPDLSPLGKGRATAG